MSTTVENKTSVSAADKTEVDAPHEGSGFIAVNKSTLSKAAEAGTPKDEVIKAVPSEDLEDGAMKAETDTMKPKATTPKKRGTSHTDDIAGAAKKQRLESKSELLAAADSEADMDGIKKSAEAEGVTDLVKPAKSGKAVKGKAAKGKAKEETVGGRQDDEGGDDAKEGEVVATPATPKKGRGRPKALKNKVNGDAAGPITPPKTPKRKASKQAADKPDKSPEDDGDSDTVAGAKARTTTTKSGAPRKRAAAAKVGKQMPISTSFDLASDADKMLYNWKEDGKSWKEINEKWTELTGEEPGKSTLSNRYVRLKANFMVLKKGDDVRLLNANAKVTADIAAAIAQLNAGKAQSILKHMEEHGTTEKYPTLFLQKELEKLLANGVAAGATASESESVDNGEAVNDAAGVEAGIKMEDTTAAEEDEMEDAVAGEKGGEEEVSEAAAEES